ncbi:BRICHOS domain-containing protein 5 [Takifugu flavidus]|uniref:BRICHOS domain-containing protein 5 n=1 Tax=Takifugu flavidus TaxID=433684 RepID=A0A5C6PPW5_9TELE|nr:BRICHOS domain-containing protein 5 [Takifugu flavidus]TWW81515.1 BRICHOS domain-containing protein 5 [Takifugu flavidus]
MVRCWKHSDERLGESECTDGDPAATSTAHLPRKAFWLSLSVSLLLVITGIILTGHFGAPRLHSKSSQIIRITAPDHNGININQSAVVDQKNDLVTFSLTSPANRTSTVLFDIKHGLICYKPEEQDRCFLQQMDETDYGNVRSLLHRPVQTHFQLFGNETQKHTEFLGVLASSQVDVSTLEQPLQALCEDRPVYWTRKVEGPGKQRLVYFCIDICFPSNVCVSVCFYYLPE